MTFISYAQNFEDVMLWRALKHIKNGFYIDIGAQDPVVDSVSLAFYEHGWRGIHVEPVLDYVNQLASARPDETVIPAAVGSGSGLLTFFTFPATGLSTADTLIAQRHKKNGFQCVETKIPVISLDEILETNSARPVHWLKLDVEGLEKDVLKSWKKSKVRPWILVIESTHPLTQKQSHQEWEQLVLSRDYVFVYFDGLNRYYVSAEHPELKSAFATAPNIFDGFKFYPDSRFWAENGGDFHALKTQPESQLYRCVARLEQISEELSKRDASVESLNQDVHECNFKIEQLSKELKERNSNIETLTQDAHRCNVEIAQLLQKADELVEQLTISKQSANHWWLEYNKLHMELEPLRNTLVAVYGSSSWRMTAPLRWLKTVTINRLWRGIKVRLKIALSKLAAYVNRHRALRRIALQIIYRVPGLRLWLVKTIGQTSMQPMQKKVPSETKQKIKTDKMETNVKIHHGNNPSINECNLTLRTRHVYKILQMELKRSCEEKH